MPRHNPYQWLRDFFEQIERGPWGDGRHCEPCAEDAGSGDPLPPAGVPAAVIADAIMCCEKLGINKTEARRRVNAASVGADATTTLQDMIYRIFGKPGELTSGKTNG